MGERIDKKHRFPLRIEEDLHNNIQAMAFNHRMSLNNIYVELVAFAYKHPGFKEHLERHYATNQHGHFVYVEDWRK